MIRMPFQVFCVLSDFSAIGGNWHIFLALIEYSFSSARFGSLVGDLRWIFLLTLEIMKVLTVPTERIVVGSLKIDGVFWTCGP